MIEIFAGLGFIFGTAMIGVSLIVCFLIPQYRILSILTSIALLLLFSIQFMPSSWLRPQAEVQADIQTQLPYVVVIIILIAICTQGYFMYKQFKKIEEESIERGENVK